MNGSKNMHYETAGAQGDIAFVRIKALPADARETSADTTRAGVPAHLVGHSETGHNHVADASDVIRYESSDPFVCYLQLAVDAPVGIRHLRDFDTHGTVTLGGGKGALWKAVRQREFSGLEARRAQD